MARHEEARGEPAAGERVVVIPLAPLAWAAVAAVFVALRLWPIWNTPVGGAELVHLSGAWNAHVGVDDTRYVATLLQALLAAIFSVTSSEIPGRLLAFAASSSVPLALYFSRPAIGEVPALVAVLLLAFDAPTLALGAESGAMGFDLAITAWLFALTLRGGIPAWGWGVAAFVVATAGPLPLPLLAAMATLALVRPGRIDYRALAWPLGGALLGVAFTTIRPGLGPDGLTIAPLQLFGAAYEESWSTADVLALTALTSWPIILAGGASAAWIVLSRGAGRSLERDEERLLLWAAFAAGWFLTSLQAHALVPLAGVTLPAAILAAKGLTELGGRLRHADWTLAKYLLLLAAAALSVIAFYVGDWARLDRVGDERDKLIVTGLGLATLAIIGALLADRRTWPALGTLAIPVLVVPLVVATSVVAFRGGASPIPSPYSTESARELREIALAAKGNGGTIAIHVDYAEELTWPFRGSGNVVVTSRIPPEAAIIVWPQSGPAALAEPPAGYTVASEEWSLEARIEPPTRFLKLVRWYTERYTLANSGERVAVYIRNSQ